MSSENQASGTTSRAIHLALAAVFGLAVVGFLVGIRQGKTIPDLSPPPPTHVTPQPDAIAATAYRDFDRRLHGPNRAWHGSLADLEQPVDNLINFDGQLQRLPELRQAVLSLRAQRRAFDGAPPVVPHPIDQMSSASCLACHGEGIWIGRGVRAPKMSHDVFASCTQCHVEQQSGDLELLATVANFFEGKAAPIGGSRAWAGAPPVVPHPTFMRESCLSCHGPSGPEPIRTTHPGRASCLQCHAPSAELDQVAARDFVSSWLGAADQQDSTSKAAP